MRIRFTKMQGAGNDFIVLDETQGRLNLSAAQYRFLADRHFGVGADQILSVRPAPSAGVDFEYVIHNADGSESAAYLKLPHDSLRSHMEELIARQVAEADYQLKKNVTAGQQTH